MAFTKDKRTSAGRYYDECVDREYIINRRGLIFSHKEIVQTDRISNRICLDMVVPEIPHRVTINGVPYYPDKEDLLTHE